MNKTIILIATAIIGLGGFSFAQTSVAKKAAGGKAPRVAAAPQHAVDGDDTGFGDDGPGMMPGGPEMNGPEGRGGSDMKGKNGGQAGKPGFGRGPMGMKMSDEDIASLMDKIRGLDAKLADKLASLKTSDKFMYHMSLGRVSMVIFMSERDENKEPAKRALEVMRLEMDCKELADSYRKAAKDAKPALKQQLQAKVSELFDAKLAGENSKVDMLEKRVSELKEKLAKRKDNKNTLVSDHVSEMLGEKERW